MEVLRWPFITICWSRSCLATSLALLPDTWKEEAEEGINMLRCVQMIQTASIHSLCDVLGLTIQLSRKAGCIQGRCTPA